MDKTVRKVIKEQSILKILVLFLEFNIYVFVWWTLLNVLQVKWKKKSLSKICQTKLIEI